MITSIFFVVWNITGIYKTQYPVLFSAVALCWMLPVFFTLMVMIHRLIKSNNPLENFTFIMNKISDFSELRFFTRFMNGIEIILIAVILYIHFIV